MAKPALDYFTITELATEFGVTPRTIRFYEDKGLLAPERQGQNRVYSRRDRTRLKLILRGRRVGFSLADIKEILDLYDIGGSHEEQLRLTLARSRERLGELEQQRRDVNEMIHELKDSIQAMEGWLAEQTDDCPVAPGGQPADAPPGAERRRLVRTP